MSNNHKNSFCPFAESLVTYLYGEIDAAEKHKFERHLPNCSPCAGELESFGFVREQISEWRDAEFASVPTPIFAVPEYHAEKPRSARFISNNKESAWRAALRRLFAFNPTTAFAAFGILTVGVGLLWLTLNFNDRRETAGNSVDQNIARASVSPTAELPENPATIKATGENIEKSSLQATENKSEIKFSPIRSTAENRRVGKFESKNRADQPIRGTETIKNAPKKFAPAKKPAIPALDDAEDDADETIRLTDLFAELDTK